MEAQHLQGYMLFFTAFMSDSKCCLFGSFSGLAQLSERSGFAGGFS